MTSYATVIRLEFVSLEGERASDGKRSITTIYQVLRRCSDISCPAKFENSESNKRHYLFLGCPCSFQLKDPHWTSKFVRHQGVQASLGHDSLPFISLVAIQTPLYTWARTLISGQPWLSSEASKFLENGTLGSFRCKRIRTSVTLPARRRLHWFQSSIGSNLDKHNGIDVLLKCVPVVKYCTAWISIVRNSDNSQHHIEVGYTRKKESVSGLPNYVRRKDAGSGSSPGPNCFLRVHLLE